MPIPPIAISGFGGEVPAVDDRLLPNSNASQAVNTWLFSGRIEPVHALVPLYVLQNSATRSVFRMPIGPSSIDYMVDSYWLEFENPNIRVIRSPTPGQDDDGRFYWADGIYPKMMTGNMIASAAVIAPVQLPLTTSPTGGTIPPGLPLWYVVTALSASGETVASNEQTITTLVGTSTNTITVSWDAVPGATGYRVYRGQGGSGTENHYFPVSVGTTTFVDTAGVAGTAGTPPTVSTAGATPYALGTPTPLVAPGVTVSGGSGTLSETSSYVYTWVTGAGEEGPPSPPTTLSGLVNAIYHVTMTAPPPAATANRNLTNVRIYRTIVSAQGVSQFYFITQLPIATLTYDDDRSINTDAVIVNNEVLGTGAPAWAAPPTDLQGFVAMAGGFLAGWRNNEIWFSVPYYPHAWPPDFVIRVAPNIVGLGVYYQSLIILTEGQPYAAVGITPYQGQMTLEKIQPLEACTSRLSIVNTPNGVLYSSPNGLINITPAGAVNLTLQMITKDAWAKLLNLDSVMASVIAQGYYAYSGETEGVFQNSSSPPDAFNAFQQDAFQQESGFGTQPGAYISLVDQRQAVVSLDPSPSDVYNVITDEYNGETMAIRDGIVYLVDLRQLSPYETYRWRSKIFTLPYLQNLGAAKVYWTPPQTPPPTVPSYFRVFAGATAQEISSGLPLRFEQQMTQSGQMFRLPSGYKALYYQFEVEGEVIVDAIHCAQTAHELRQV